jgi:excisionase family DNA binding protein
MREEGVALSDELSEWITTKEAAELTGYDPAHIRLLVRQEKIVGRKFGKAWMVNRESAKEYVEKMKELGSAKHDPRRPGIRRSQTES